MTERPFINHSKCTLCMKCVNICPKEVLEVKDKKINIVNDDCMLCSHCYSVCKFDAVSFEDAILKNISFKSFNYSEKNILPGGTPENNLINLFRSRRSTRKFKDIDVPDDMIEDLITFGITAPSGSNSQNWEFSVVNGREKVWNTALEIGKFFKKLNRMAANPLTRYASILLMGTLLLKYHKNNYDSVERALNEAEKGKDLLFHGAPCIIIVHSNDEGSLPLEDAQYATYNMCLLAHSLGLGTCYIGYASESINRIKSLKDKLKIPQNNKALAVLAIGYSDTEFIKPALRKPWKTEWI